MRQKLITLCPNSFEIAQKKGNFSQWVRNKLLEDADTPIRQLIHEYKCPLCKTIEEDTIRKPRNCQPCDYKMTYISGRNFE